MSSTSTSENQGLFAKNYNLIQEKTGLPPVIVLAMVVISFYFVVAGRFDEYVTNIVGIVYPSLMSLRAIESKDTEDDTQWLIYWTIYFTFHLFELFFRYLIRKIPFYFICKLTFLVWLFLPITNGALFIYNKIVKGLFSKYEKDLDKAIN